MFKYIIISIIISITTISSTPVLAIITSYTNTKLCNKIQNNLFNHLIKAKYYNLNKFSSMSIISRFTSDASLLSNLVVSVFPQIISMIFLLISAFIVLFRINNFYAFISILFVPIFVLLSKIYARKQKEVHKKILDKDVEYNSFIQESMLNSVIVKIFIKPENLIAKLNNIQKDKLFLQLKKTKINSTSNFLTNLGMNVGYLSIFTIGAIAVCFKTSSIGSFSALIQLFQKVQGQLISLSSLVPQLISGIASLERINEIYELPLENSESLLPDKFKFENLSFKNLSFFYNNKKNILDNISINISIGDIVGIIGSSGKGKTTILKLAMSLLEPKKGSIYINDEILEIRHRNLIAYVPQGNNLFSGTIRDNLICNETSINDEDIDFALKTSCAYDFINELPKKLNTFVGENGIGLSQGQCQRIAIARAVLSKRSILILDEATSALDSSTEAIIMDNINKLKKNITVIMVTHRSSTLKNCNKILDLNTNTGFTENNINTVSSA